MTCCRSRLISVVDPELHEQATRESNYRFVNNTLNVHEVAIPLAHTFNDVMIPFFQDNSMPVFGSICERWLRDLTEIFTTAAKLKAQSMLREKECVFWWPSFDASFNPRTMVIEGSSLEDSQRAVQMALFPALLQRSQWQPRLAPQEDETIFHATVVMQTQHDLYNRELQGNPQ